MRRVVVVVVLIALAGCNKTGENTADPTDPTAGYRDAIVACNEAANEPDGGHADGSEHKCETAIATVEADKNVTVLADQTDGTWNYWVQYGTH